MSRPKQIENGSISSVRQAAAACNVSAPVVRRWLSLGLLSKPPWTLEQLREVRDRTDPDGRRRGTRAAHGTITRWNAGCSCAECRRFQSVEARARGRARAQQRLPADVPQRLLDAIYAGQPFRAVLKELGLTSNQVWGLTRTDEEWSRALDGALTAARRDGLRHGTNAAYVAGCACKECREHQRVRMAREPLSLDSGGALRVVTIYVSASPDGTTQKCCSIADSPADGVIATVIKEFPDQPIGSVDLQNPPGNQVVVDIGRGRFIAFGHLQSGSIKVSDGERVQREDIIGLVGNSGNSDEPHLHVQAQNRAIFDANSPPPGLITYPLLFDDAQVRRGGRVLPPGPADVRRGDRFSTIG